MLRRKSYLSINSCLFFLTLLCFSSCKKQKPDTIVPEEKNGVDFFFDLKFGEDTLIVFSNTETYTFYFQNSTGEGRCIDTSCVSCAYQPGQSGVKLKVYNLQNDSILLQPVVYGCRLEEEDSLMNLFDTQNANPNFHFFIGAKKIAPYPTNYSNNSIDFTDYVCTFRIKKM